MRGSLKIGRVAGIPVGLHWSLLVVGGLLVLTTVNAGATGLGVIITIAAIVLFFTSILAHELSHALVARRRGVEVAGIDLWLLGGMARLTEEPPTPRDELRIAAAGPLASLACGLASLGVSVGLHAAGLPGHVANLARWLGEINLVLAAFNLLPASPLDGGRILRAFLWGRHGSRERASITTARAGRVVAMGVIGLGLWLLWSGRPAFLTILVGWFILNSAKLEEAISRTQLALGAKRVRDVTWFGVAQAPDYLDVDSMLDQSARMGKPAVVAIQRFDGSLSGLVSLPQLFAVPEDRRSWTRLAELVVPFSAIGTATPDDPAMEALSRVRPPMPVLTVFDGSRLVGVVTGEEVRGAVGLSSPRPRIAPAGA